jgi:hypothetical protein
MMYLFACSQPKETNAVRDSTETKKAVVILNPASVKAHVKEPDTTTRIKFSEFQILISRLVTWDPDTTLNKIQGDSCYVVNDIGESVLGQKIKISNTNLVDLKIEQRFETSVSIANEGPHCDLLDWVHYTSEWIESRKLNEFEFVCNSYSEEEQKRFPPVSMSELKHFVRKQCGNEWFELIKDIKQPNEGPSWVGISKVFLRISGIDPRSGKRVVKVIAFEEAMGC